MKQFLTINDNGDMLNIDMIAAITPTRNGCTILTKDGCEFHSVFNLAKELEDDAEIRAGAEAAGMNAAQTVVGSQLRDGDVIRDLDDVLFSDNDALHQFHDDLLAYGCFPIVH